MGAGTRSPRGDEQQAAIRAAAPFIGDVATVEVLSGGAVNTVFRVTDSRSSAAIVKTNADPPADLFAVEAEGLRVLDRLGGLRVPRIHSVDPTCLVLEALTPELPDCDAFWTHAGRAIAQLHQRRGDRFGWRRDGWLGRLPQVNTWSADGHEFFAERRLLRYLAEPPAEAALSRETRRGIERLCARLPQLVPAMPPVLTHGDLWRNNMVAAGPVAPAFVDPAVSWSWAETDLSMALADGGIPDCFFQAYNDIEPLEDGWRERADLLNLRELLSIVAHFGPVWDVPARIDATVRRFVGSSSSS
jgi:fructosamine-3-kinase